MKKVRTLQRYKCDFCKYRSVKHVVALHEKRCFRNPNRFCDYCDNKGKVKESYEELGTHAHECSYCALFDKDKLKSIEQREESEKI